MCVTYLSHHRLSHGRWTEQEMYIIPNSTHYSIRRSDRKAEKEWKTTLIPVQMMKSISIISCNINYEPSDKLLADSTQNCQLACYIILHTNFTYNNLFLSLYILLHCRIILLNVVNFSTLSKYLSKLCFHQVDCILIIIAQKKNIKYST